MSTVQGGYAGRPGTKAIFDEAGSFCASLSGERSVHYTRPRRHDEIICQTGEDGPEGYSRSSHGLVVARLDTGFGG
jgi:hypothetical protein